MATIYELSWNRTGFWAKLVLVIKSEWRMLTAKRADKVSTLSALSSTYYSVLGTAFAFGQALTKDEETSFVKLMFRFILSGMSWAPLGLFCAFQMEKVSDRMLRLAGGYENISVDQCDIRQSILRGKRRWDEARRCIGWALAKGPTGHTFGLLSLGIVDVLLHLGKKVDDSEVIFYLSQAVDIANTITDENPQQAIRLYRGIGLLIRKGGGKNFQSFLDKAEILARGVMANDQLAKLGKK